MSEKIILNFKLKTDEDTKKAPVGFSWTTLFFGPAPAIWRNDWKFGAIQFLVNGVTGGLSLLVWPFIYNKMYIKDLISDGFKCIDDVQTISDAEESIGLAIPRQ